MFKKEDRVIVDLVEFEKVKEFGNFSFDELVLYCENISSADMTIIK